MKVYLIVCGSRSMGNIAFENVMRATNGTFASVFSRPVPDIRDDEVWEKYPKQKNAERVIKGLVTAGLNLQPGDDVLIRIGNTGSTGWDIQLDDKPLIS